jgi:hypothetical protein
MVFKTPSRPVWTVVAALAVLERPVEFAQVAWATMIALRVNVSMERVLQVAWVTRVVPINN